MSVGVGTGAAVVSVMVAIARAKMVIKDVNRVILDISLLLILLWCDEGERNEIYFFSSCKWADQAFYIFSYSRFVVLGVICDKWQCRR